MKSYMETGDYENGGIIFACDLLIFRVMGEVTIMGEVKTLEDVDIIPGNPILMS